jgi:hypothetical protein
MEINYSDLLFLAFIGLILLVLDRVYRINFRLEGFTNPKMCGVDMEPCAFGKRCMNGFCVDENQPALKPTTLPVFP